MTFDLTDTELTLLTAAADGELSPAEAKRFDALVAANPRAAALARQLRADAARLRKLPRRSAPAGLLSSVMARLPVAEPVRPSGRPLTRTRRSVWLPYAVAASALFTVSAASFWFFTAQNESARQRDRDLIARARQPQLPVARLPDDPAPVLPVPPVKPDPVLAALPDVLPLPREVMPPPSVVPPAREVALAPRPVVGDFVAAGIVEPAKPLHALELRLPFVGSVADFAHADTRERFAATFGTDPAVRIDLFARNLPAGAEQLAAAARAAGVAVTVDAATQDRLGKKTPAVSALLVDGLTSAELAKLLAELAKPSQPAVSAVHAFAAGAPEQKEWKELFGRDLGLSRTPRSDSKADPQSPVRPISDGTLGKLKNSVGRNPDKAGLLLTYLPARTGAANSKEIKAFLDGRGDRKAGTVTAVFVVRPPAN